MALKLTKKPAKAKVTKTKVETVKDAQGKLVKDKNGEAVKNETIISDENHYVETPATVASGNPVTAQPVIVEFSVGSTHNVGDYNSVKFHVGINIPCQHDEIEGVFDFARTWCEGKLNEVVAESLGE